MIRSLSLPIALLGFIGLAWSQTSQPSPPISFNAQRHVSISFVCGGPVGNVDEATEIVPLDHYCQGYSIWRSEPATSGVTEKEIADVPSTQRIYDDFDVQSGTTYTYWVSAYILDGPNDVHVYGLPSQKVTVTIP